MTSEVPELPLYIVSHSLGGVIALDYCLYHGHGIAGLVTISPAISYEVKLSEKILITLMGKLKPDFTVTQRGNTQLLTHEGTPGVYFADADLECSGSCVGRDNDTVYEWTLTPIDKANPGNLRIVGGSTKRGNDRVEVAGTGTFGIKSIGWTHLIGECQ